MTHPHGRAIKNNEVALCVIIYKDISDRLFKTIWFIYIGSHYEKMQTNFLASPI